MKHTVKPNGSSGFSLIELTIAMMVMMILLGVVSSLFSRSMTTRTRESRRTDALTSAQAALNVMSREISNSGFGILTDEITKKGSNGIVFADSGPNRIHFRANISNSNLSTDGAGEDITYFFDAATDSIVRYDPHDTPQTSVIINRISEVTFTYYNYQGDSSVYTETTSPTINTGRIRINVKVTLDPVIGQPAGTVTFTSDVTLRNSEYMLKQY
jgi:Tfp pilus assembly protein PilW